MMPDNLYSNDLLSTETKLNQKSIKPLLKQSSLTVNNKNKTLSTTIKDDLTVSNNNNNKSKKKLSTTELINQINQQQVNSLMYSFVTFEGKYNLLLIMTV